ncbi:hypothetical protein F4808DRAFT_332611 [Astrocystis sublimbata]|nr:hypothetical protein F4808DRAFT_332611 [Astrocystis sublimbata]
MCFLSSAQAQGPLIAKVKLAPKRVVGIICMHVCIYVRVETGRHVANDELPARRRSQPLSLSLLSFLFFSFLLYPIFAWLQGEPPGKTTLKMTQTALSRGARDTAFDRRRPPRFCFPQAQAGCRMLRCPRTYAVRFAISIVQQPCCSVLIADVSPGSQLLVFSNSLQLNAKRLALLGTARLLMLDMQSSHIIFRSKYRNWGHAASAGLLSGVQIQQ